MELDSVIRRRHMVRQFEARPVPPDTLDAILDNTVRAPSAGFSQGWGFLVLNGADEVAHFRETVALTEQHWYDKAFELSTIVDAPVVVVCWSNKSEYLARYAKAGTDDRDDSWWPAPYWDIDTGFAAMLMMLTAVDRELGSCFFGISPARVPALRRAFGVPDDFTPIGAVAIGYPLEPKPPTKMTRRPFADVVHHGRWNQAS